MKNKKEEREKLFQKELKDTITDLCKNCLFEPLELDRRIYCLVDAMILKHEALMKDKE